MYTAIKKTVMTLITAVLIAMLCFSVMYFSPAIGASNAYILLRYILPNVVRPVLPLFTLMIGHTVLSISGLGFLGFGIQPPTPEIGMMIKDGVTYITRAPWMILFPGTLLTIYILCINLLGDELREWFNPRKEMRVL